MLVIGSGSLTHNLYEAELDNDSTDSKADYVHAFQDWVYQALQRHDHSALAAWATAAPHARRAHPTPEHFLPLLVAYAAAGDSPRVERVLSNYCVFRDHPATDSTLIRPPIPPASGH